MRPHDPSVQANSSQNPKQGMSNDELVSQVMWVWFRPRFPHYSDRFSRTLMLAGQETTASTMNWLLWELSKDAEYQALCREEIARVRSQVVARGDDDFSMTDMENMPHVTAIIKVSGYRRIQSATAKMELHG